MNAVAATLDSQARVFRVDRFVVPRRAETPFVDQLHRIQAGLDAQPGCRQNLVLKQSANADETAVVTIVEWESAEHAAAARVAMQKKYQAEGFDSASFMQKLGVRAEFGVYRTA